MNIPENILSILTDEQKKKVAEAKTPQELIALAKEYGQEITSEQLDSIAAGFGCWGVCSSVCNDRTYDSNECHSACRY